MRVSIAGFMCLAVGCTPGSFPISPPGLGVPAGSYFGSVPQTTTTTEGDSRQSSSYEMDRTAKFNSTGQPENANGQVLGPGVPFDLHVGIMTVHATVQSVQYELTQCEVFFTVTTQMNMSGTLVTMTGEGSELFKQVGPRSVQYECVIDTTSSNPQKPGTLRIEAAGILDR